MEPKKPGETSRGFHTPEMSKFGEKLHPNKNVTFKSPMTIVTQEEMRGV